MPSFKDSNDKKMNKIKNVVWLGNLDDIIEICEEHDLSHPNNNNECFLHDEENKTTYKIKVIEQK